MRVWHGGVSRVTHGSAQNVLAVAVHAMGLMMAACVSEKRHVGALGSRAGNGWSGQIVTTGRLTDPGFSVVRSWPGCA